MKYLVPVFALCFFCDAHAASVRDFGAVGDGVADDTIALQAALNYTASTRENLMFEGGKYRTTSGLFLPPAWRNRLIGEGGAEIMYDGLDTTAAILTLSDPFEVVVEHLALTPARPCATGLYLYNDPATSARPAHNCTIKQVRIDGGNGKVAICFRIGGLNANNDFHQFEQCQASNYSLAGASLEGSQVYATKFINCHFRGYGFGQFGITNSQGPGGTGGSFSVQGGFFGGNMDSDVYLGTPSPGPIELSGFISEGSKRLLRMGGTSASSWIKISGVRWVGQNMAADRRFIYWAHCGTLILENCNLALYSSAGSYIYTDPHPAHTHRLVVTGCSIASTDPVIFQGAPADDVANSFRTENVHDNFALQP